jgi:hypothetical protein
LAIAGFLGERHSVSWSLVWARQIPWDEVRLCVARRGERDFGPLASLDWQAYVYGRASEELNGVCHSRGLALHSLAWNPGARRGGFKSDAAYLLRPDGYVGLADPIGSGAVLERYLDKYGLRGRGCAAEEPMV